MESHKINVPNHQPVIFHPFLGEISRPLASKPSRFRSIAAWEIQSTAAAIESSVVAGRA